MQPVAILDDGVSYRAVEDLAFRLRVRGGQVCPANGDGKYRGHASTVARILRLYAPDMPLASIDVIGTSSGLGTVENLVAALDFCAGKGIRLVNVSLGTQQAEGIAPLRAALECAAARGLLVVAAASNDSGPSYPACLENAIGVRAGEGLAPGGIVPLAGSPMGIDFAACARHRILIDGVNYDTPEHNSFAAPAVTARLWRLLQNGGPLDVDVARRALAIYGQE